MSKTKRWFALWLTLGFVLSLMAGISVYAFNFFSAKAEEESTIATDINQIENWDNGTSVIFYLSESDYMTATEWSTDSNESYKWVTELAYEDREDYNVCNAVLDKNLASYNYADKILIDGIALKEYSHLLVANRYTRVDSLGILFNSDMLTSASQIVIKEGCQLPSLTHSYFGERFVCLETQEELVFTNESGNWVKGYSLATDINQMENWDNGTSLIFHLSESDYMTATEWSTDSNESYKWVTELAYEDRENYNVCNAVLDKNLENYNYADKILIDGIALKEYPHSLVANRYTRVDSLGILFNSDMLTSASQIVIKEGCQLPSLTHSYFGERFVCLETQEELVFTNRNGNWVKGYPFDGYEAEVEYDANERYFYLRNQNSTYKGHTEAPTSEFTNVFSVNDWGDDGYTLASTADTLEGTLCVADLVHPIEVSKFNVVKVRVFSNVERTIAAYNASNITEDELGTELETFTLPAKKFTEISLTSNLYANENGEIECFVFRFMDNGSENYADNQFFIGSFSCLDNYYHLTFPTNVQGDLTGQEIVDVSKVFINGECVNAINSHGDYVEAVWAVRDGYYQIDIKFSKSYDGAGVIKNADLSYAGNNIQVAEGLTLPNGEALDRTYTYHIYKNESFLDYELIETYEELCVENLKVRIEASANNNIHFLIVFDKEITKSPYYHACETEEWRDESLVVFKGMYDKDVSNAFVSGGFKSSFYDNILINGISVGEWHAIDDYPTCVHVHYGQTDFYTLDMSIDSYSEMYKALYEAFEKGDEITIEIKSGIKFTTSTKTEKDYKFVVKGADVIVDGEDVEEGTVKVFYDGKQVNNGDVVVSSTEAMESNIFISGTDKYTVTKTTGENTADFIITFTNGEVFTLTVQENIVNEIPTEEDEGCSSNITSGKVVLLLSVLSLFGIFALRRKKYE